MNKYKAIRFSLDGDWVTDHKSQTIEGVWENVEDAGSRWFFYPICFVITYNEGFTLSNQRIVDAPEGFSHLIGKSISTVSEEIAKNSNFYQSLF